tara:strand:+ start:393 stop:1022 length:630 start_codon:yes stop_codon:yes gene_type:complete
MIHNQIVLKLESNNLSASPAIDKARKFPSCPSPISIEKIFGSWKTVQISCPTSDWKIAVRTNIDNSYTFVDEIKQGKKNRNQVVVALNMSVDKGEVIKEEHLSLQKSNKKVGGGIFYEKNQLIGRTLKRALSVGTIIKARHLTPNWIIEKDQIVTIEHQVGSIMITAKGIAQESGQLGQRIWVNNFNSGKKVLCWIKNDKKVTTNAKIY